MRIKFVSADTGSKIEATCKDDATAAAINLTGATVKLRYRIAGSATAVKTMTVTNAAGGIAEYLFAAGELIPGAFEAEVEIVDSSLRVITSLEKIKLTVREKMV